MQIAQLIAQRVALQIARAGPVRQDPLLGKVAAFIDIDEGLVRRVVREQPGIHFQRQERGAQRMMQENKIRHLPVVNPAGGLLGLVTRTTLEEVLPSKLTTLSV